MVIKNILLPLTKQTQINMEKSNNTKSGITGLELLLTAFIVLKLCKVIDWSWWWVLSPFWIPLSLAIVVVFILAVITAYNE